MTIKLNFWLLLVIVYIVGAFWTFGTVWNNTPDRVQMCDVDAAGKITTNCFWQDKQYERAGNSVWFGVIWPIYWAGKVAITATAAGGK